MSVGAGDPFTVHDLADMPDDGRRSELIDVLVARWAELTRKNLPTGPVLAVEVLSPSGRLIDLDLKRAAHQRMGSASYWIINPEVPDLLVLELDAHGEYAEVARVGGDEAFLARLPFPVRVVPAQLLGRLRAH